MKTVLVSGCFDPAHFGHLLHFRSAKAMGDYLVVAVTSDLSVAKQKPGRPMFTQGQRAEFISALRCVDHVVVTPDDITALQWMSPRLFVKGPDYNIETIDPDTKKYCEAHNIQIGFTDTPKWSSTELIRELRRC